MYWKQMVGYFVGVMFGLVLTTSVHAQSSSVTDGSDGNDSCGSHSHVERFFSLESSLRADQRIEALRTRLLEIQMKEMDLQNLLDELDYQMRPDEIARALAFVGSVRPMDELRDDLRRRLENQKARISKQLEFLAVSRERLEAAINAAEKELEGLGRTTSGNDSARERYRDGQ